MRLWDKELVRRGDLGKAGSLLWAEKQASVWAVLCSSELIKTE